MALSLNASRAPFLRKTRRWHRRILCATLTICVWYLLTAASIQQSVRTHVDAAPPDRCFLIGYNDASARVWQRNSRAVCVASPVCFPAAPLEIDSTFITTRFPNQSRCDVVRADGGPVPPGVAERASLEHDSCEELRYRRVLCAHGKGHAGLNCPAVGLASAEELSALSARGAVQWHDGLTILVPNYGWVHNIYHYGRQLNFVTHIVTNLHRYVSDDDWRRVDRAPLASGPLSGLYTKLHHARTGRRRVTIAFRLLGYFPDAWHVNLTSLFVTAIMRNVGVDVNFKLLSPAYDKEMICLRHAVVLGMDGEPDSLQFLNDSAIKSSPAQVPVEALHFKERIYDALGFPSAAVPGTTSRDQSLGHLIEVGSQSAVRVPPLQLGYARRAKSDSQRNFRPDDEQWFRAMLRNETSASQVKYIEFGFHANISLSHQVKFFSEVGFVVGIHGANLVNSMFMRPASALFEIFPYRYVVSCGIHMRRLRVFMSSAVFRVLTLRPFTYVIRSQNMFYLNGGNSGLRYSSHQVMNGSEFQCKLTSAFWCGVEHRNQMMNLTGSDRDAITKHVRDGLKYLTSLNGAFPNNAIPMQSTRSGGDYSVQGFTFPASPRALDSFRAVEATIPSNVSSVLNRSKL